MQVMLYWLWGNVLCAGSLSFSALCSQARPAVLVAVIWVIMSGFGASFILTQFVEQGPSVAANILQIIPSMGLFRGLPSWNLKHAAYANALPHMCIITAA